MATLGKLGMQHCTSVMSISTAPVMIAAQRLYTSMGFRPTPERPMPDGSVLLGYELRIATTAPATR